MSTLGILLYSIIIFFPRDEATQLASLKIVQGMLNQLDMGDIRQLLPYLTAFAGHSSIHCRITMYNVLMNIYNSLWYWATFRCICMYIKCKKSTIYME